ncbi:MAG: Uma2 family endonuclease [Pirellulaceae bacterium]|nr:Uma2 family endonuclease [Pirellulaceae bacterium]
MIIATTQPATLEDLYRVDGKAELIGGRIVHYVASGYEPSRVALEIAVSLRDYARSSGKGVAFADGIGFAIRPLLTSGRQSFSPGASYYVGPLPANRMRFVEGAPIFAVEVRSEDDYGPSAELDMAAKRADYFEAGTQVVWDVDPEARTVTIYRSTSPLTAERFVDGQIADAEPALPGWRLAVSEVFGPTT